MSTETQKQLSRVVPFTRFASAAALAAAGVCFTAGPLSAATATGAEGPDASTQQTPKAGDGASQPTATGSKQTDKSGQRPIAQLPDRYKVSAWIGKSVKSADGEELGTVEEMIMDDFGLVRYVVMKSDQLASEKKGDLVAVPTGLFEPLKREQSHLVLDVPSSHMSGAPSFSSSEYPNMGQESVSTLIVTYWVPEDAAGAQDESGQGSGARNDAQTASASSDNGSSGQRGADRSAGSDGMRADRQDQDGAPEEHPFRTPGSAMEQQFASKSGDGSQRYEPNRQMVYLPQEKAQLFDKLDEDRDGVIGRNEAEANTRLSRQFDEINSFANQGISRSEFAAFEIKDAGGSQMGSGPKSSKGQQPNAQQPEHQMGESPQSKPMDQ